jgi:hypothetical protein
MKAHAQFAHLIKFSALVSFICGLICASGCTSASTSIEVKQAPATSPFKHKTIVVEVTTKDLDFDSKEIDQLTGSIVDGLRKSAKFENVYVISSSGGHDADLKLSVLIQFTVGANINRTENVETSVTLTDTGDGKTIADATVNYSTGWNFFGVNMSKAIVRLGDQIVDFVTKF